MPPTTSPAAQTRPTPTPRPGPKPAPRPVPSHEKFEKMKEQFKGDDEMQKFLDALKRLFFHS